jgi:hypothetical protein
MKKLSLTLLFLLALLNSMQAQEIVSQVEPTQTASPKIMVIPYTSEGQDIRTVLENDVNKRIALTKIKEAFDQRGYTTVDFFAKLKNVSKASALGNSQQQDAKTMIIQQSGADVYVEAEINLLESSSGNAVKVILSGYETSTANSLANAVCESGKFYTDDYGKLTSRAIEKSMDNFLNTMQAKLADIAENGQSISVTIGIDEASTCTMMKEVGTDGLTLSDALELWVEEHSYKGNYHIQGTTDKQMLFDDIRIPLKDANGRTYNANKFGLALLQFFRNNGLKIERTISNNMLVITVK